MLWTHRHPAQTAPCVRGADEDPPQEGWRRLPWPVLDQDQSCHRPRQDWSPPQRLGGLPSPVLPLGQEGRMGPQLLPMEVPWVSPWGPRAGEEGAGEAKLGCGVGVPHPGLGAPGRADARASPCRSCAHAGPRPGTDPLERLRAPGESGGDSPFGSPVGQPMAGPCSPPWPAGARATRGSWGQTGRRRHRHGA